MHGFKIIDYLETHPYMIQKSKNTAPDRRIRIPEWERMGGATDESVTDAHRSLACLGSAFCRARSSSAVLHRPAPRKAESERYTFTGGGSGTTSSAAASSFS